MATVINADVLDGLKQLPDDHFHCCVTSPPYWGLRDYGCEGQIGLESSPEEYVAKMVEVFREVRRVLRPDGVCWLNIASSYAGGGFCQTAPSSAVTKSGQYGTKGGLKTGGVPVVTNEYETFVLRDDLTVDEVAYVLSELAKSVKGGEVS